MRICDLGHHGCSLRPEDAPTAGMWVQLIDDELCKLAEEPLIREEVRCIKIAAQVSGEAEDAGHHLSGIFYDLRNLLTTDPQDADLADACRTRLQHLRATRSPLALLQHLRSVTVKSTVYPDMETTVERIGNQKCALVVLSLCALWAQRHPECPLPALRSLSMTNPVPLYVGAGNTRIQLVRELLPMHDPAVMSSRQLKDWAQEVIRNQNSLNLHHGIASVRLSPRYYDQYTDRCSIRRCHPGPVHAIRTRIGDVLPWYEMTRETSKYWPLWRGTGVCRSGR